MESIVDRPAEIRRGEELDLARLAPFLERHFPSAGAPIRVAQFPGGHSNLTYLVRLGDREFVLRRPPFGSKVKTAHDMSREYRVLSKLHGAFSLAPKVLLYCDDLSVLNAPFYLMEPVRGVIIRRDPPPSLDLSPDVTRRLSESFIDTLVRLHALDFTAIGLGDLGKPDGYLERQVRGWIERYNGSKTDDLPEVPFLADWLVKRIPASRGAALIHNDYKYDNIVLDSANVTRIIGLLDWEMCTLGDPLSDLGTALAYWVDPQDPDEFQAIRWCPSNYPGSLSRRELADRYARESGRDISDLSFYLAFARFKVAVIVQQIYYRYRQGLTSDPRFAGKADVVKILMRSALHAAESGTI